ncbi:flavin reductase family protein [Bosea sp. BK604]|uniref:flavin reductase family protein n=1 Tax=Bosea sp. BK604 TaxID=2512180 RepID=UPI0010E09797|nr:flavin reductase family protein [Bosea sp. BK604]TCR60808.1 flavin reductase [Bosea sp. BK604]
MSTENKPAEELSPGQFWQVLGRRATGMTIVTTRHDDAVFGFVGLSATHVTAQPPTLLVSLDRGTTALGPITQSGAFAVNYLANDQRQVAEGFLARGTPMAERFSRGNWDRLETGAPVLQDALGAFDCRVEEMIERPTAVIVIGRVVGWSLGHDRSPLVFHKGALVE